MNNILWHGIVFLISPLLSLMLSIKNVLYNQVYVYFIGAFFAVFGAFLPPTSDAYRYRQLYYHTTLFTFNWENLWVKEKDFLFVFLSSVFNGIGATFELFKLFLLLVSYFLYGWMFLDILKNNPAVKENKVLTGLVIASLFFSIRLFTLTSGIRFGVASTIVVAAIYLWHKGYYLKAFITYVLSVTMHFSMLMFLPIGIGACLLTRIYVSPFLKTGVLFGLLLLSHTAIGDVLRYLFPENNLVLGSISTYIEGKWGTQEILKTASFGGIMFTFFRILPVLPLAYIVLKKGKNTFILNVCFLSVALLCISMSSITLLLRYSNVAIALLFLALLMELDDKKESLKNIRIALLSFIMMFGCYTYTQRASLSRYLLQYRVILSPIMLTGEHTYTDEWVKTHLDLKGEYYRR